VEDLGAELGLHRRAAYRLIAVIESAGIAVEVQPEGRERYYRVRREVLRRALRI
jgi:DNA-binding transcriptional ArsR family regulator